MNTLSIEFDELKKDNWSEKETKNVKLIIDFVQHLMNKHDFDYVSEQFGNQIYTQHNRSIPDGMVNLPRQDKATHMSSVTIIMVHYLILFQKIIFVKKLGIPLRKDLSYAVGGVIQSPHQTA